MTNEPGDGSRDQDRGVSELVGIILLFGMVFAGAILVLAGGTVLLDQVQMDSYGETARSAMDVTNNEIATVATSGQPRELPFRDIEGADPRVTDDGRLEIAWFDTSTESSPLTTASDDCSATVDELGSIEYVLEDRTIAYQGGGTWEKSSSGDVNVRSAPGISYDGQRLEFNLVKAKHEGIVGSEAMARSNATKAEELTTAIEDAQETCNKPDVKFKIESEYHQGWADFFNESLAGADVDHNPSSGNVVVTIEDVTPQRPYFQIDAITAPDIVDSNQRLTVPVTVENTGDRPGSSDVTLEMNPSDSDQIDGLDPEETASTTLELKKNEIRDAIGVSTARGNKHNLSQYGEYEYTVSTSNETVRKSFFWSYPRESYYNLTHVGHETDKSTSTTEIVAETTNIGSTDDERDVTVTLEQADSDADPWQWTSEEFSTEPWNDSTIRVPINRSKLSNGEYTYTVSVDNPSNTCNTGGFDNAESCERSGTFRVEDGIDCSTDECEVNEATNVSVSVIGTEISAEGRSNDRKFLFLEDDGRVVDAPTGTMRNDGVGQFGYEFAGAPPRFEDEEMELSEDGGWVAADGSTPEANIECHPLGCWAGADREWQWDADELVYDEDEGYELEWSERGSGWSYEGPETADEVRADRYKQWAPVTATVHAGDDDYQFTPQSHNDTVSTDEIDDQSLEAHNLNTYGTQERAWDYESVIESGTVSIASTYWECETYDLVAVDESDATGTDSTYFNYECTEFGDSLVTAESRSDGGDSGDGFIMTRSVDNPELPDIEEGYPRQRDINEVFQDGTDDVELEDGQLTLTDGQFPFMIEVTMNEDQLASEYDHQYGYDGEYQHAFDGGDSSLMNSAAWDIAKSYRHRSQSDTNDPNFNDVIGFIEVEDSSTGPRLSEEVRETDEFLVDGTPRDTQTDHVRGSGSNDDDSGVQVGTDYIVIG